MSTLDCFKNSPHKSIKQNCYFPAYDKILSKYVGQKPTIVEIGILGGGSLFMWRDFLGEDARIIGVELNPQAIKWRDHGFEIYIGDQSSDSFWDVFFEQVGDIDILIDDGGHTNFQQLKTLHRAIPHVKDGGCIIIEDTHASYMKSFGNPSKYSFANFCAAVVHKINDRYFFKDKANLIRDCVSSMEIFESMTAFYIDRKLCYQSELLVNEGQDDKAQDFRVSENASQSSIKTTMLSKMSRKIKRKANILIQRYRSDKQCKSYF